MLSGLYFLSLIIQIKFRSLGPMTFTFSQNISKADTDETESFNFNLGTTF